MERAKRVGRVTLAEAKARLRVLSSKRLSPRVTASIGQQMLGGGRAQYMSLLLEDERGSWIVLRLSTVRSLARFVEARGWVKARRLSAVEKLLIDARSWVRDQIGSIR